LKKKNILFDPLAFLLKYGSKDFSKKKKKTYLNKNTNNHIYIYIYIWIMIQ